MSFHRAVSYYGDLDNEDQGLEKVTSDSHDFSDMEKRSLDQIMQFKKEIKVHNSIYPQCHSIFNNYYFD